MDLTQFRVNPGEHISLAERVTEYIPRFSEDSEENIHHIKQETRKTSRRIEEWFGALRAQQSQKLWIIEQGMATAGKNGSVTKAFQAASRDNFELKSYKKPSRKEQARDFLYRHHKRAPKDGYVGISNRSYYEHVIVPLVYDEHVSEKMIAEGYESINDFEKHLRRNGTYIQKMFLHVSQAVQTERLHERQTIPKKKHKLTENDLIEQQNWEKYIPAHEQMLSATSTEEAPWYIIPADNRTARNYIFALLVEQAFEEMNPEYPRL